MRQPPVCETLKGQRPGRQADYDHGLGSDVRQGQEGPQGEEDHLQGVRGIARCAGRKAQADQAGPHRQNLLDRGSRLPRHKG